MIRESSSSRKHEQISIGPIRGSLIGLDVDFVSGPSESYLEFDPRSNNGFYLQRTSILPEWRHACEICMARC